MYIQQDTRTKLNATRRLHNGVNIQFTLNPAPGEAAIRKCSENKYLKNFDRITNSISIKTEYRGS